MRPSSNMRDVALVIFQVDRRLGAPLFRHARPQVDISFINMAVGVDDQNVIEIVHRISSSISRHHEYLPSAKVSRATGLAGMPARFDRWFEYRRSIGYSNTTRCE